jgi:hypothetical protein
MTYFFSSLSTEADKVNTVQKILSLPIREIPSPFSINSIAFQHVPIPFPFKITVRTKKWITPVKIPAVFVVQSHSRIAQ